MQQCSFVMKLNDIPTPETNAAIEAGSDPWDLASGLERRLILIRDAAESLIAHHLIRDLAANNGSVFREVYAVKHALEQTAP